MRTPARRLRAPLLPFPALGKRWKYSETPEGDFADAVPLAAARTAARAVAAGDPNSPAVRAARLWHHALPEAAGEREFRVPL